MTQRTAENWLEGLDTDPNPDYVPEYASWPKVSGNRQEAEKLAAVLRSVKRPDPFDLPAGDIPEYTVTRNFEDGVSNWIVMTSVILPESGLHRVFFDAGDTSLLRDPLELAFEILGEFDYNG